MGDEIERRYGIEITTTETIRDHVHNIKTEAYAADQLIHELCLSVVSMQLRYRATANGFEIYDE